MVQGMRVLATRALGMTGAALLLLAGTGCQPEAEVVPAPAGPTSSTSTVAIGVVKSYGSLSQDHVQTKVNYPQNPPVGGPHAQAWANCGLYDKVIPNENAVHSLEHGAVWVTYKPGAIPEADLSSLKTKLRSQDYVLMSQNTTQATPIVLTAWGKQMHVERADDSHIDSFLKQFVRGPQTPEPNATCSGGYDPNTGAGAAPTASADGAVV